MLSMDVVFTQILVILLYIVIGYIAGKAHLIDAGQRKYLTTVCTSLILPFTILSASSQSLTLRQMADLGLSFLVMLGLFIATTFAAMRIQAARGVPMPARVTTASLVTYPNCTFLGLPLCRALFGDMAILYNAVAMVAFNALFFTWQCSMFTGQKFRPRNLATPGTIATFLLIVMLLLRIQFPAPVQTVVSSTMLILRFLPGDAASRLCQLVYLACPCATLTSIYAIQCDMEPELAARSVLMSTLFFSLSLPIIISAGMRFFG